MTWSDFFMSTTAHVHLFTDGACSGNPGPGGWAFILRHLRTGKEKYESGASVETTNNQMELTAVIEGLKTLQRPCRVILFTDSKYVGNGMSEWMPKWKANGWARRVGKKNVAIKNLDLWKGLDSHLAQHAVEFSWVAGHSGHEENDQCDAMAVAAYQRFL
jgi:ribonuclease HI